MTGDLSVPSGGAAGSSNGDPLAAVRIAVLARAAADARRILANAEAEVTARLADANGRAAQLRVAASKEAADEVAAISNEARARARRQERAILLAARQAAFVRLQTKARVAVGSLREDPRYPALMERLAAAARERLGPDVVVHEHPDGGVTAEASGRRLSLTLSAAADRAIDALGVDVEQLWQP